MYYNFVNAESKSVVMIDKGHSELSSKVVIDTLLLVSGLQ